jgi:O-acetyl-ADP-ribose deacetylase (regulator of RNase III)
MKIKYVEGNLFDTKIKTIVHGCNAQGAYGAGVAAIIRRDFPQAYHAYKDKYEKNGKLELGSIIIAPCGDGNADNFKVIINAITQEYYGRDHKRYVSYNAIADAMSRINLIAKLGLKEVAMPKIGAGLAGGNWNIIEAIVESELKDVQPHVYVL